MLLHQLSYAIKNQLGHPKPPSCSSLVLYGIRIGDFHARKGPICVPNPLVGGFGCDELVLYGIRELAQEIP